MGYPTEIESGSGKGIAMVREIYLTKKAIINHRGRWKLSSFGDLRKRLKLGHRRALAALGYGTLQTFDLEEGIEKGRIGGSL